MNPRPAPAPFASRRRRAVVRLLLGPVLVVLAITLPKIWQGEFSVDTGWYAAIALQAYRGLATHGFESWWTLQGGPDAMPYFNKPPLAFWLNGLPLALFGPTIWAARLGSVIAAALCVVVTTLMVRRLSGFAAARGAGLILATSIPFVALGRSFSLDLWLTLLLLLAAWALLLGHTRKAVAPPVVFAGVCLGLGLLVKPFVGLLALIPVLLAPSAAGRSRWWRATLAAAIAMAVAGAWHALMWRRFGDVFWSQYFGREIAERAAGNRAAATFNLGAESPLYYLRALGETYWPWAITVVLAIAAILAGRVPRNSKADRAWLWFGVAWTVVWLVGLSLFADKRPRYLAPVFPVLAWMSALWLTRWWGGSANVRGAWRRAARFVPIAACVVGVVVAAAPIRVHKPQDANWTRVLAWIEQHPDASLHRGGFVGQRMAKVYLKTGRWPELSPPAAGDYVLYHARDGLAPGPNEEIVLRADKLLVTRLLSEPWTPAPVSDPGE